MSEITSAKKAVLDAYSRVLQLARYLCDCDTSDSPPTDPNDRTKPLRHHCECIGLYIETALDPESGHQHEPCLTIGARQHAVEVGSGE